jgi:hypothetical protein
MLLAFAGIAPTTTRARAARAVAGNRLTVFVGFHRRLSVAYFADLSLRCLGSIVAVGEIHHLAVGKTCSRVIVISPLRDDSEGESPDLPRELEDIFLPEIISAYSLLLSAVHSAPEGRFFG